MKKFLVAVCLLVAALTGQAAVGNRHIEKAGGFSLQAPKGWEFRELPGMKYQIAIGPAVNNFSPNINVVDEPFEGELNSYVDSNINTLKKMFVQFKMIKRSAFVTAKGLKGEKIVTTSLQQNNQVRQIFYFLPGNSKKFLVLTCTTLASSKDALDSAFDESVRTLEIIPAS